MEIPLSSEYMSHCGEKKAKEFTHVRYTPITTPPRDFGRDFHYLLRPTVLNRDTELFIVVTLYNEDEKELAKTLHSVFLNIAYLCKKSTPRSWGPNGWQNVIVIVVADGRSKINPNSLALLSILGVFPGALDLPHFIDAARITAHLFEVTSQVSFDGSLKLKTAKEGLVPVQLMFLLKEQNLKKIDSHRWFFSALGPKLNPNICLLIDAGTVCQRHSLYHLWRGVAFDRDHNLGGACGELVTDISWRNFLNPLVATQHFEYKMSNILDKPLESVFGYIQVLPGAFSAYRYIALQDSEPGIGPLTSYFRGDSALAGSNLFSANMYLAEDRILCFELITKNDASWRLKYVRSAKAVTDVPKSLPELISQRRRWLNGSFFAALYAVSRFYKIFNSNHSAVQISVFVFQTIYIVVNIILSWFSVGNYYIVFVFIFKNGFGTDPFRGYSDLIFSCLNYAYIACLIVLLILVFGNRPQGSQILYYGIAVLMTANMGFVMGVGLYRTFEPLTAVSSVSKFFTLVKTQTALRDILISLVATYGIYFLSSLLYFDPWHAIFCITQYILLLPTWINVFTIFSFANLHDTSWGTKGDNVIASSEIKTTTASSLQGPISDDPKGSHPLNQCNIDKMYRESSLILKSQKKARITSHRDILTKHDDYFRDYRTKLLLLWIFSNVVLVFLITGPFSHIRAVYLTSLFWLIAGLASIRLIGSVIYLATWTFDSVGNWCTGGAMFVPRMYRREGHNIV